MFILEKIKSIASYIIVGLIAGLSWYGYYATKSAVENKKNAERQKENSEYYQRLLSGEKGNNTALRLTV